MKKLLTLSLLSAALLLSACQHHRDVRPGAGGVNRVRVQSDNERLSSRSAIKQANYFCEKRQQYASIIKEETKYVGSMKESTYKTIRAASNAAKAGGAGAGLYAATSGKSRKSKTAKIAALAIGGGAIGTAIAKDGYRTNMTFRCE